MEGNRKAVSSGCGVCWPPSRPSEFGTSVPWETLTNLNESLTVQQPQPQWESNPAHDAHPG
eukprot:571742-Pelagomonas_calceolata.AAC.2